MIRTFTLDITDWSKEEVQLIPSAITGLLFDGGYAYVPGSVGKMDDDTYTVHMTDAFPFTSEQIRTRIHADDDKRDSSALDDL